MKQRLPAFILSLFIATTLFAGDRYWVGGSGSWHDAAHWSSTVNGKGGARVPTIHDVVYLGFDVRPYADTITIDGIADCGGLRYEYGSSLIGRESAPVVLAGKGEINVSGEVFLHAPFVDLFTGVWKFIDRAACYRDSSVPGMWTSGHVFTGKVVFPSPAQDGKNCLNSWTVSDVLYVNNTLETQKGAQLIVPENAKVAALNIVESPEGKILDQGGRVISGNSQRVQSPNTPLSHSVTTVIVPNLCNGNCNATATAVVTGGSGSFSYQWSNAQTTQTATNLCAGTYLVVVTDLVNGDQIPAFAIVTDPPPLVIFFFNTPATCFGNCDGTSSATVAGGTPGYTYAWSPAPGGGQGTPNATGLCAGTYTLTVTDSNGCQISMQSIILQPALLIDNGTFTNVTCFGFCDGTASVTPAGGTAPYTYDWLPGNPIGDGTPNISNLCPGTYTCNITDANGCTDSYVTTITQPQPLQATLGSTNASCFGVCDGTASSTVSGGTTPYNYNWMPGNLNTPNITGLCAGTYTLTVTDDNGCVTTQQVTVTEPNQLNVAPTGINIACFATCTGIASANASGGTPGYAYSWAPAGGTGPVANNLCPDTYTVTVTDTNGCTTNGTVAITEPTQLFGNAAGTDITCFGACNGSATANPSGGTGPYTYLWMPGNLTTQTISNLCPGTYTVTVTDANNCSDPEVVTITEPTQLQTNAVSNMVSCFGACDGTATASPSGGTPGYTYLWLPGGQTTPSVSGWCPGTYTLTVTDANGCTRNQVITITQPNQLTVGINATSISCNSACSAVLSANVSGGTPVFTYSWAPGGQTTPSISNQCAGSYTVDITDANGCTTTNSISITQPTPFQITTTVTDVTCNNLCNGAITVSVSGSSPPYTYSWAPGGQTTPAINGLCAGSYTLTINDASGCDSTIVVTVTEPTQITTNATFTNATCSGVCNGTAAAVPSGGTGPYTYLWMPGSLNTSSVSGLCAGTYTLTVTDANGCTANQTITITQPPPLSAIVTSSTASCGSCNGSATVSVSGGTSPYAYFWTPTGGTNPTATNLCIGNYTCTVTDGQGCTTTATVTIVQVVNITITPSASTPSCFGSCDAVASANAAGGAPPYTYLWQPGNVVSQNLTGLCAGSYTVTATDANGCFNSDTIIFTNPAQLAPTPSFTNVTCNGACDGTASVSVTGGTGGYSYLWSPGNQTTASISGLCPGTYSVTIDDANGCDTTVVFNITEPTLITANETSTPANCTLCDGSITTSTSGGVGPYTYSWAPGGQTTPSVTNLCPGIYTVTITDASGCPVNIPVAVSNLNGPTLSSSSTNVSCNGGSDGTATVVVTGGAAPFTYDWTPGSPAGDGTPSVTGLTAGTWFVQVTDAVGCITFQAYTITEPQPLQANATITNASCGGVCDGSISLAPSGGTGPFTYSWTGPSSFTATTATITGLCAGTYTVDITDANNCVVNMTFAVTEPLTVLPNVTYTDITCNGASNGTAQANVTGGTAPYSYSWTSGQLVSSVVNLSPGSYTVTVTDANGCSSQQSITITEPPALVSVITSTNALCNGSCDGTASVFAAGGSPGYAFLWSPGGQTTSAVNGLCAGAYSVTTSDTNGCTSVQSVTILQPNAMTLSTSVNAVSCFGNCDGVAMANANGGTPSYSYSWAPSGGTAATATALCPGIYTVTLTDANGCMQTATANVTQPAQLQSNTGFTSPQCNGNCDGAAWANPIGGTGPFTYLWATGGQTTDTITNQCPGTYTVTVRDANGCQDVQTVNVLATTPMTLSVASAPANCGSCNGTINVVPSGGTGPYTYSWTGGLPPQANQVNVCAGVYTVTVVDAMLCSDTFVIALNNSGGPTGETVVTTPVSCPSGCDGTATVTPVGGTSPYTYSWIPGGQTVNSLTNMCGGSYFLQVTDSNGCIRFSPVTIAEPAPILANAFVTNASCSGICDGAITVTPSGGTGPYTYVWAPGGQTTATITNLCTGTYTVYITDANGCLDSATATVNPWNSLIAAITSADPTCSSLCNGTATANVSSGTAPFIFQWNDPLGQSAQTATGLCAGTYSVLVTDAAGCNSTIPVTLTGPTPIVINPAITPTTCGQCNGSVTLNAAGGTAPYSYTWSNGAPTSTVSNLCAGVYTVDVSDATGCTASFTINISSSGGPTATNGTVTNVSCSGACDGAITVAPAGGILPYTYNWLPGGQTTPSITSLCAGTYTVQVMDSAGCARVDSFNITAPPAILPNQSITNADCGVCNGSIVLNTTGGTGPYTYNWLPGGQTTSSITGQCGGLYTVTITDATGCTVTQSIPVSSQNSTTAITASGTDLSCNGTCDGSATVTITSGTGPFTFSWSNGATNDTLTGLCAGTYLVQVTDGAGCVTTAQVTITQPTPLAGSFLFVQDELCTGACDGFITAIPSGGTLPYQYSWQPNGQTTATAVNLCNGIYTVTITDANGCSIVQSDTIVSPVVLVQGVPVVTDAICSNSPDGAIDITITGGALPYTYSWTGPAPFAASTEDVTGLYAGTYTVIITDANGCQVSDTITVNATTTVIANAGSDTTSCQLGSVTLDGTGSVNAVSYQWIELPSMTVVGTTANPTVNPPAGATLYVLIVTNGICTDSDTVTITTLTPPVANAGPDVEIITGMTATIGGTPTGPSGSTYAWGPSTGLGDPTQGNPVASPSATTTYTVVVTDANGCTDSDTMTVIVVPEIDFPNGFTPNGDGINDVWVIDNIYLFPNCQVEVYNRWGELLFVSIGYNTPWDGRYDGKDLPVGTYYYIIQLNDPMFPEVYTGPITIIR